MPRSSVGLILVVAGGVLIIVGLLAWLGALSWFGRLPGDIRIERPNARVYVPITSMVLLSIALSIVVAVLRRFR
ncbi:MAG TPA: DUF2905 domain-containing protein [Gemmatimonadaceae bacterium]|jgi:Protein of unknown function (DUF2905).